MGQRIMGVVTAHVAPEREEEFLAGIREILAGEKPDGFLRYEVLRGRDGLWLIHSVWRDREAMSALRAQGKTPAALMLLDRVGATHSHDLFTIEVST
ncbi:antibiotic biosynthesis monooxygenase family protein [Tessaracoccus antarcticus]|nr:antibiotic biosynthesis monooxygenase family protein [Tessaracoccus antarcticus]